MTAPTIAEMVEAVKREARIARGITPDPGPFAYIPGGMKKHAAALAAAAEALKAQEWRPIGECPDEWKDGRPVLLRIQHQNYPFADDVEKGMWEEAVVARWTNHNHGGWVWNGLAGKPTHIRLIDLPAPPAAGEAG